MIMLFSLIVNIIDLSSTSPVLTGMLVEMV